MSIPEPNLASILDFTTKDALKNFYDSTGYDGLCELYKKCYDSRFTMSWKIEEAAKRYGLIGVDGVMHNCVREIGKNAIIKNTDNSYSLFLNEPNKGACQGKSNEDLVKIFDSLKAFLKSGKLGVDFITIDLIDKSNDPSIELSRRSQKTLKKFGIIKDDGSIAPLVRQVVLTCIKGEGLDRYFVKEDFDKIVNFELPLPKSVAYPSVSHEYAKPDSYDNIIPLNRSIAVPLQPSPYPLSDRIEASPPMSADRKDDLQQKFAVVVRQWVNDSDLNPKPTFTRILFNVHLKQIDIFNATDTDKINDLVIQRLCETNIDAILKTHSYLSSKIQINAPWENFIQFVENPVRPF